MAKSAEAKASGLSEEKATPSFLPQPKGFKLLIALLEVEEKTEGGIIKPDTTRDLERVGSVVGMVLKIGLDAYKDPQKFPTGPYCKEGDFVVMKAYSGVRLKIRGKEFRLINDDQVDATVEDPRGIERA